MKLTFIERLKSLFTGKIPARFKPPQVPKAIEQKPRIVGSWNGMNHQLWFASNEHIKFAQELYKQPSFRDLLAVLSNATPSVRAENLDPTRAAFELGRVKGYNELFALVLSLPTFPVAAKAEIEADYATPDTSLNELN